MKQATGACCSSVRSAFGHALYRGLMQEPRQTFDMISLIMALHPAIFGPCLGV